MSILKDCSAKFRMVFDRKLPAEARAFAALECLFQPVSFATLIAAVAFAVSSRFGRPMPASLASI